MNIKKKYKNHTVTLNYKEVTVSTNTDAMNTAADTLIVADRQTGGKGRRGRTFVSNKGGVYMSLSVEANKPPSFLTTAAAVCAAEAVEDLGVSGVKIKWVNDLYFNDKKICGILVGANTIEGKTEKAAVGVGLNLVKYTDFDDTLKQKAGYLFEKGDFECLREKFINSFLSRFYELYDSFDREYIFKSYTKRDYLLGKEITFIKDKKEQTGKAIGFDKDINLLVKTKEKTFSLFTGEVSVGLLQSQDGTKTQEQNKAQM